MKFLRVFTALAAVLVIFTIGADAQRTTKKTTPKVVTTSPTPTSAAGGTDMRSGAEKVAIQVKNVSKFIYVLGGVAKGIEDLDKDPKANKAARDANETNKREVILALKNLRAGLTALEIEFRTKPTWRKAVPQIDGIAILSQDAESLAVAGKFVESGKPLLQVVEKLSDTLVALR